MEYGGKRFKMNRPLTHIFPFEQRGNFGNFFFQNNYLKGNHCERIMISDFVVLNVEMDLNDCIP